MTYDDAAWHAGSEFPADLPPSAGATHTGMYVAWAVLSGLGDAAHAQDAFRLAARTDTPGAWFLSGCGGRFTDADLTDDGNAFTQAYFDFDAGSYLDDYEAAVGQGTPPGPQGLYYVEDGWDTFDRLAPVLDRRFDAWRAGR